MKNIKFGAGFTIFILFFGIALIEAIRYQRWLSVAVWATLAVIFLASDNMKRRNKSDTRI